MWTEITKIIMDLNLVKLSHKVMWFIVTTIKIKLKLVKTPINNVSR